jgi:transcriptional regulator with XRE-family HTH domain
MVGMTTVARCFSENLARELANSPLSQEELAVRAGLHRTHVAKLLGGEQVPRIDTMITLEAALGLKPATLIEGVAWDPTAGTEGEFVLVEPD